ncbi:MAG: hypothetical protein HYU77_02110 [Betaproteobacteria bacterium]|nr:hypothetical protein [Betaproteobacteria bacterium]
MVYLSDHAGKAVSSEGVTGVVTLLHGGKNAAVTIRPDGIDRLSGYVHFIPNAQLQIVVTLTFKDGVTRTATFTPFARPSSAAAGSRDGHASHHQ